MDVAQRVASVRERLAALEDPRAREINERHGDAFGVNLAKIRALAKELGRDAELGQTLWATGETPARLVALLVFRPKDRTPAQLDAMIRESNGPKERDWLMSALISAHPQREEMRQAWFDDSDPFVAAAGWTLTWRRVEKDPDGLDLAGLLDRIDAEMGAAPEALQWAMNSTLAQIGIHHPELRERALEIGERLGVLRDYPVSRGCTSPFAPLWISEMVRRQTT